jgi:hypothetical protein
MIAQEGPRTSPSTIAGVGWNRGSQVRAQLKTVRLAEPWAADRFGPTEPKAAATAYLADTHPSDSPRAKRSRSSTTSSSTQSDPDLAVCRRVRLMRRVIRGGLPLVAWRHRL